MSVPHNYCSPIDSLFIIDAGMMSACSDYNMASVSTISGPASTLVLADTMCPECLRARRGRGDAWSQPAWCLGIIWIL